MNQTKCYSYFSISSNGEIKNGIGFVAGENSDFDPEYLTELLGVEPFETKKMGEPNPRGTYTNRFSDWCVCKQTEPELNAEEQCLNIVRALWTLIPKLKEIKNMFNVSFLLMIVPYIYNEESPVLGFNSEIIDFCYHTGTEICIDMYVFDKYEEEIYTAKKLLH